MDNPDTSKNSSSASSSNKGKECAAFGCSNTFYGPDGLRMRYHFFKFPKDTSRRNRWCNLIKRQHGKDGFSVTDSTVICSDHFKKDDIKKTLTGRWDLVKGLSSNYCLVYSDSARVM